MRLGRCCVTLLALTQALACAPAGDLPDDGFVDVPGGRVAFSVMGGGDATPLLVIHGGPGSTSCIYPSTLTGIAAERPIVLYDQLGSGNSDRMTDMPEQAKLSRFVAEVEAVREELGLSEIHLLGHSWGAAVALEYLLTADPTGVRSVLFVGPLLGTGSWIEDANHLVTLLPDEMQEAVAQAVTSGDFDSPEFQAANKAFLSEFGLRSSGGSWSVPECDLKPPNNGELYRYMWGPSEFLATGTLRDYNRVDRLHELRWPVLFLVGEFDEARPETMYEFQELVPGSTVRVIPEAGHVSNIDQPETFNRMVIEFLAAVEAR